MRSRERGHLLILVVMLLGLGSLLVIPALNAATTGLKGKQVRTGALKGQYTRDAGTEFAIWQLIYGGVAASLDEEGEETSRTVNLNGEEAQVTIRMNARLGDVAVDGAEDNKIRPTVTVECDQDNDGFDDDDQDSNEFDDDCLALPQNDGMKARYTVFLDQVSPDTSAGLVDIIEELPSGFSLIPGSVISSDGSLSEIESITPVDIEDGNDEIWKWTFSPPIYFQQGEVKQFTFTANITNEVAWHCNQVFLKLETPPIEKSGKYARIKVGSPPGSLCQRGGLEARKYSDRLAIPPLVDTVVTYIVNIQNVQQTPENLNALKDVLPQDGFEYCSPSFPPDDPYLSCDPPMSKVTDRPFNPETDDFDDLTGFEVWFEPQQTYDPASGRWGLLWDPPGAEPSIGAQGSPDDTFIVRFQAHATLEYSGVFYNEAFVVAHCPVPRSLRDEGVTRMDYCSDYSWPSAGVVVATFDVRTQAGGTTSQSNVAVDWSGGTGRAQLVSWHIN